MRNAPPTLPGMPSRNSTPASPARLASTETCFNFAPAPQRILSPTISTALKLECAREITTPRIPPSRTSRFDPRPSTKKFSPRSAQNFNMVAKSASLAGSTYTSAKPPTRSVVFFANGSFARTKLAADKRLASSPASETRFVLGDSMMGAVAVMRSSSFASA